jgi:hypothetical protein
MNKTTYRLQPSEQKSTRDCLDPWFFAMLDSRRRLMPCCWHPPLGVLAVGQPLEEILDGPGIRELRRQLLTGDLNEHCAQCPARALTDTTSLLKRLRVEMAQELQAIDK